MMPKLNTIVAIFETHDEADNAIRILQKDGIDMKKLSVIGRDYHTEENVVGYYNAGNRMLYWGKLGAFWGGFWGLLLGSGFFWIPGVGQLLVAGPIVGWIVGALEEAAVVGGLSALGVALFSIGIPNDSIVQYETEIKNGKLLLILHGTANEVEWARDLLKQAETTALTVHSGSAKVADQKDLTVQIDVQGRKVPFDLDWQNDQWHSSEKQQESDFPLVTIADGKRCMLYSDGTFAEVEK